MGSPGSPPPPVPLLDDAAFRRIAESAMDPIVVTDLTLRILWANDAALRLFEAPRQGLVGTGIGAWLAEGEASREPLRIAEIGAGMPTRTARRIRTATGRLVHIEVNAQRLPGDLVLGVARDVTERVGAAEQLARSEASFRTIIEQSPDAIVVHRRGTIVYANPACATVLGLPDVSSMIGQSVLAYVHPDEHDAFLGRTRALHGGPITSHVPNDGRIVRADGTVVQGSVTELSVVFEGVPSTVAIVRDLTEIHRMQGRLALADRMASLGTLAAGVAHEINNPLTYVMLRLDALVRSLDRARAGHEPDLGAALEQMATHLASAVEGASAVRRIVRDMRAFSAVEDAPAEVGSVRRAVELAVRMVSHELRGRVAIAVDDDGTAPVVQGGEGRLAQVVLNLVVNAAQAFAEPVRDDARVAVVVATEGARAVVRVRDNGPGMSAEIAARIFEPFFTTKPVGKGTGLGLFVCHGLVEGMGGSIRVVESSPEGTTLEVVLPCAAPARGAGSASGRLPEPSARVRFLVVEDEPSVARALAHVLAELGSVTLAANGTAAQERLDAGETFDVVLCDVRMPGLGGPDLYRWAQRAHPAMATRFAFMTGGVLDAEDEALIAAAPGGLFRKPFDAATVLAHVRRMLDRAPG